MLEVISAIASVKFADAQSRLKRSSHSGIDINVETLRHRSLPICQDIDDAVGEPPI
jgi:hypothetical protein